MHQGKDVIGEAGRVGVVLLDPQVGLVVQQAVEHIGGIADADIHHAGAERRVLVGDMGIEQPSRLATVLRVDVPGALAPATTPRGSAGHRRMRSCRRPSGRQRRGDTGG
nr:Mobilization_integration [Citrobacter youngae]